MILQEVTNVIPGLKVNPRALEIKSHKDINNVVWMVFRNNLQTVQHKCWLHELQLWMNEYILTKQLELFS